MNTDKIEDLLERVEKATEGSREMDAAIVAYLNNAIVKPYPPTDDFGPKSRWQFWSQDGEHFLGNEDKYPVPPLTTSIDAALALVEQELPGWGNSCGKNDNRCFAYLWSNEGPIREYGAEGAPSRALAIITALLKALKSQSGGRDG